ncbi:hypothetical protein DVJ77_13830 [Dyella tabacisoli]|uniref:Uncharacterized protein n=2 Tax=Dyella tabacisoli TaxID=2282381 RepID=A0A369UP13_9GAMM|nr:hypothetical protein DVJ77_13830 [Dyella tabacisoli]
MDAGAVMVFTEAGKPERDHVGCASMHFQKSGQTVTPIPAVGVNTMQQKMTVITNKKGEFIGAIRLGTIKDGNKTYQVQALPHPDHKHHHVEVDDALMGKSFDEVRDALLRKIQ